MKRKRLVQMIFVLVFFLTGCASLEQVLQPQATVTSGGGPSIGEAQMEPYDGPKARVAVTRFTDKTAKGWYTGQIGDSMADMLTTALFNTNRFIVLERETLDDVMAEQELGASGRVRRNTAPPIGAIEGAELLIKGTVTEFEPGNTGISAGIGSGYHGWGEIVGSVIGSFQRSHIAIDIRVIDAATSRVLAATSVEGKATDINFGTLLFGDHAGGGLGMYHNTPVEKAIRAAINTAVNFIAIKTPPQYYHYK